MERTRAAVATHCAAVVAIAAPRRPQRNTPTKTKSPTTLTWVRVGVRVRVKG